MAVIDLLGALRDQMTGEVLGPTEPGYDRARRVANGMIDRRPALIASVDTLAEGALS